MIDKKLAATGKSVVGNYAASYLFDVEASVIRLDDPQAVMGEWFHFENREYSQDYGVVFFRVWETFSLKEKIEAVI